MKKTRRWLALLLAVILVGSNALYQIGTSMSASETETTAESGQQDDSAAVPETQDQDTASLDQQKDTGGVQVQEVTPQTQQEQTNSQSEAAKTQQVQPAQNNTSASDQNTQAVSGTESAQKTPEEKNYHVTIQKSDVDGGTIKAWGADGNKADVTYNSENKYVKEVKEGEEFNFEITAKDTYKVAKVTDQNGTTVEPKAVNNNVYTYEVKNITAERTYSITYVKEEVKKAESTSNGDQQKSDDEQSEDADDDGEPAAKVAPIEESGIATLSITGATTVEVGSSIVLSSNQGAGYTHRWKVSDEKKANISGSDQNATLTGKKAGQVTVTHEWGHYYWGWNSFGKETYTVTVTKKSTTRVYVYVKLNTDSGVDTSEWTINKDGWYTIGYVDLSSDVLPSATEKNQDSYYSEYISSVTSALGNIHYYETNRAVAQGIDLSNVEWSKSGYGLKVADGASDYAGEAPNGTNQWHLDGLLR